MVVAVVLGLLAGLLGGLPLVLGVRIVNGMDAQNSAVGYLTPVLLAVMGSLVVLALATVLCVVVAREFVLPFVLSEAAALVVAALVFGFVKALRN